MAVYAKGIETKRKFVELTYNKLLKQDASTITVRDLVSENDCTPPALYRHFKSLDYLILVSSARFLDEYIFEFCELLDKKYKTFRQYIELWKLFNTHAFNRPDLYYRFFWGQNKNEFSRAMQEYFELFPILNSMKHPAYFNTLFMNSNIQERDYLLLHPAVRRRIISAENADFLSRTNTLIAQGLIGEVIDKDADTRKHAEIECTYLVQKNLGHILREAEADLE